MFYVKENINDTVEVKVELNDENVFCTCPDCGKEVLILSIILDTILKKLKAEPE